MKEQYHFTVSRSDRIYLVTFCVFLLGWELVKKILPEDSSQYEYLQPPEIETRDSIYNRNEKKYSDYAYPKRKRENPWNHSAYKQYEEKRKPVLHPVDIMTAGVEDLYHVGFSKKTAFNIRKYVAAGGTFHSASDLMKVYGMDSMQLNRAASLIVFASPNISLQKETQRTAESGTRQVIDLNTVSAPELETLQGIGETLADRIIRFRESLGGFISPDQLKDCYGITPETFAKIRSSLVANGQPKKIRINEIELKDFSHPYLNKKLARIIDAYQDHHGPFTDAQELRNVYPSDSAWLEKILPYLDFSMDADEH